MSNQLKSMKLYGTTDSAGDATITGRPSILGWLIAVKWIDGDLADGVDAVLSATVSDGGVDDVLLTLTNANSDAWYRPRELESDNAGAALATYTLPIIDGTLALVIASGGDAKTGGCIVYYTDR